MSPSYKRKRVEALEIVLERRDVLSVTDLWQSYKEINSRYAEEIASLEEARESAEMAIFDQIIQRNKELSN